VVDSSITIVATPRGQRSGDSFDIALLGPSQLKGEADDAPIFLNYSAQFTGDNNNITNPHVIVQSTWTSEKQWQHEEVVHLLIFPLLLTNIQVEELP
jgi:hypothetical protein